MFGNFPFLLTGTVIVKITGEKTERFMNLCIYHGYDIWDFKRFNEGLIFTVQAKRYKSLRPLAKETGCHLHIVNKKGLPFWLRLHKIRYGLLVGAVGAVLLLNILCSRIWLFEIQGNTSIPDEEIENILAEVGVVKGADVDDIDWASIRQAIMTNHTEVAWMSLNPQGTILFVDISETKNKPDMVQQNVPCHVIAERDGVITNLQANQGSPVVQVGDAVVKGDVLISGAVEYKDGTTVFRHADGEVVAETKRQLCFTVPYTQKVNILQGKPIKRKVIQLFNLKIPLYFGSVQGSFQSVGTSYQWKVGDSPIPIKTYIAEFQPTQVMETKIGYEEAVILAKEKVENYMENNLSEIQVEKTDFIFVDENDKLTVKCEIFCKENISFQEKMLIF